MTCRVNSLMAFGKPPVGCTSSAAVKRCSTRIQEWRNPVARGNLALKVYAEEKCRCQQLLVEFALSASFQTPIDDCC
jgi:hypothetical protein